MGNLTYGMMVSLDGLVTGPDGDLSWHLFEEEIHDFPVIFEDGRHDAWDRSPAEITYL